MFQLQRFTTAYHLAEDRVQLTGETKDRRTMVIFMTRRLLDRLVPQLVKLLSRQDRSPISFDETYRTEALEIFAYQAARLTHKPQLPVQPDQAAPSWRVDSITITPEGQNVKLLFAPAKSNLSEPASMYLTQASLRQWLNVLSDQYNKAEWSKESWPAWLRTPLEHSAENVSSLN